LSKATQHVCAYGKKTGMAILLEVIFMHIMQEMHIVCMLKIELSHSLRLTVGKQHCSICIVHVTVKKLAECGLQNVRKEVKAAIPKTESWQ
jgi:hypothetical protein